MPLTWSRNGEILLRNNNSFAKRPIAKPFRLSDFSAVVCKMWNEWKNYKFWNIMWWPWVLIPYQCGFLPMLRQMLTLSDLTTPFKGNPVNQTGSNTHSQFSPVWAPAKVPPKRGFSLRNYNLLESRRVTPAILGCQVQVLIISNISAPLLHRNIEPYIKLITPAIHPHSMMTAPCVPCLPCYL